LFLLRNNITFLLIRINDRKDEIMNDRKTNNITKKAERKREEKKSE